MTADLYPKGDYMRTERFPPYFIAVMMLFFLILFLLLFEGLWNKKEGNEPPSLNHGGIPHLINVSGALTF